MIDLKKIKKQSLEIDNNEASKKCHAIDRLTDQYKSSNFSKDEYADRLIEILFTRQRQD